MSDIEVGKTYKGTVKAVRNFGVFVECVEGKEGLVHISELDNCRIDDIDKVCSVGDIMTVKCIGADDQGRVRLSRRAVICEEQGVPYEVREVKPKRSFSDRGPSRGFGGNSSGGRSYGSGGGGSHSGNRFGSRNSFGGGRNNSGGGGFGRSRRPSSRGSDFGQEY
jgi:polyribonucleotide nucleotidyltransferase